MKLLLLLLGLVATSMGAILGVDYGQQFTKAVLLAPGASFEIVLTDDGKRKDLSGVSIRSLSPSLGDIERVYGSQIGSLCTRFPQSCITGIKPLLGKSISDPVTHEYLSNHFGVKIIEDSNREEGIKFDLGFANQSFQFIPEEILAMNLHKIKQRGLAELSHNPHAQAILEEIAISIPPFASQQTRESYLQSLYMGDFSTPLALVEEGTAVALNFLSNKKFESKDFNGDKYYHMVYDVGAGSTTATLFSYTLSSNGSTVLDVESVGFDETFGGQLLTKSIFNIIYEKFLTKFNLDDAVELSPKVLARLLETAEKAKIVLSVNSDYHVSLESLYDEKDFKTTVSREEFEDINSDLMERITQPILDALENAPSGKKTVKDLQSVILNGGSSRVPFIQKHLITLLGDDKIAKTVNADESCALGTTLRAFKIKTGESNKKDIKLVDRSFHNYEYSIDNEEESTLIFSKGQPVHNLTTVSLGDFSNRTDITINLHEDGTLVKKYTVDLIQRRTSQFKCKNPDDTIEGIANLVLDSNKIFAVYTVQVRCKELSKNSSGGFFQKLLNKEKPEDAEEEQPLNVINIDMNDPDSAKTLNFTESKPAPKKSSQPKPIFIEVSDPIFVHNHANPDFYSESYVKLAELKEKDEQRVKLSHVRNVLETKCYELRGLIDENEEVITEELNKKVADFKEHISDVLEWLDFDSDNAGIKDINKRVKEIESMKNETIRAIDIQSTDLSLEGWTRLYEEGSKIAMEIQTSMLDYGSEISEIRKKYGEEKLDFDKENDRIKLKLLATGDENKMMSLDKNLASYKDELNKISEIIGDKNFSKKYSKAKLYSIYESLSNKIAEMLVDVRSIEKTHKARVKLFNTKFNRLLERRKLKELKAKLKEEQEALKQEEAEKAEAEAEDESKVIVEEEDIESPVPETEPESEPVEAEDEAPTHDEL